MLRQHLPRRGAAAAICAGLLLAFSPTTSVSAAGSSCITEFPTPTPHSNPWGITTSPDRQTLWFTEDRAQIGRITPRTGFITEFPTGGEFPNSIVAGPDGNLWFTLAVSNEIGRSTQTGVVTRFRVPTPLPPGFEPQGPIGIIVGHDGRLWFAENSQSQLGAIDPGTLRIKEYPLPPGTGPWHLTIGRDHMFWVTEFALTSQIGRVNHMGRQVRGYAVAPTIALASGITLGRDLRVWFPAPGANSIGAISVSGTIAMYPLPAIRIGDRVPAYITTGPDGNLWFTEQAANNIGRMRPDGTVLGEFAIPTPNSGANQITVGPDGNLWFTEIVGSNIARLDIACATAP